MTKTMSFYGCDTGQLAEEYGTPLYVVSEDFIRERCREMKQDFLQRYENTKAVYASKAFQVLEVLRIVASEGLGLDVVSGGELYAALQAGFDPALIEFHGNAKSEQELRAALEAGVGTIVVDNLSELILLDQLAGEAGRVQSVLLRVTPGVDSHTHEFISTGQLDSKFGFAVEEILGGVAKQAEDSPNIDLRGFHYHVGSQLHDNSSHIMATKIVLNMLSELKEKNGYEAREINCGGGFGVHYAGDPQRTTVSYFMDPVMKLIDRFCSEHGLVRPTVTIEPGRWVVGEAGITLYEVCSVKTNAAGRTYIGVDGGFPDNPRPELYDAKYEVEAVEKHGEPYDQLVTVAGKCCESGDIVAWDVKLPELERGDHIAVLCTGAYNHAMASNYNRIPKPAVVMVKDGKARLAAKRETYADLIRLEI